MASWIGGLLGLASLIFTWSIFLDNWSGLGLHHKIFLLVIPTIFATIVVLAFLFGLKELSTRLVRRLTGQPEPAGTQPPTAEHPAANFITFVVLVSVALGLFALCDYLFG